MINPELERLLNDLVPFAEHSLSHHGWFEPYGGTITVDTAIEHVSVEATDGDGDGECTAEELFNALVLDLRRGAGEGEYVATAIFRDVQLEVDGKEVYAINVFLEHICGICIEVNIPYRQSAESGIEYGESVTNVASPRVFC